MAFWFICLKNGIPDLNYHDNTIVNIKRVILSNYCIWLKTMLIRVSNITSNYDFSQFQDNMHFTSLNNPMMAFKIRSQMVGNIPDNLKKIQKGKEIT